MKVGDKVKTIKDAEHLPAWTILDAERYIELNFNVFIKFPDGIWYAEGHEDPIEVPGLIGSRVLKIPMRRLVGGDTIESVGEAESLPAGSIVRDDDGLLFSKFEDGLWGVIGSPDLFGDADLVGDEVIYRG